MSQTTKPKSRKSVYIGAAVLVIVIILAASTYLYYSTPKSLVSSTTSQALASSTAPKALMFQAKMVSSEEVPPNTSPATGSATVTISPDGNSLHFVVTVNNISNVTLAHIHLNQTGKNGAVVVNFYLGPVKNGTFTGTLAQGDVTSANFVGPLAGHPMSDLVKNLQTGMCYANVHTTAHRAGEIRGQFTSQ